MPTLSEAIANFDGISYAKGASVLKQLVAYVGRDSFFAGIHGYLAEHGWANATLADLLRAITASSGKDLAGWSAAWLETAGPNTLRSQFEVAADGAFTSFAVLQEAPAAHPTLRPHHIAIGLYHRADGALARTRRVEVDVTGPRTAVPELVGAAQPDLILLNDDDLGYATRPVRPAVARHADRVDRGLHRLAGPRGVLERGDRHGAGGRAVAARVRPVAGQRHGQRAVGVGPADPAPADRAPAGVHGRPGVGAVTAKKTSPPRPCACSAPPSRAATTSWPGRSCSAGPRSHPTSSTCWPGCWTAAPPVPGLAIDTELRWTLLARLAATGRAGDAEIDAELARDETDAGQRHAAACRAAIPDAEHKAAAWVLLAESEDLGVEGVRAIAQAFTQPEHAALLTPYAERYFEILPTIWATRGEHFRVLLGQMLFPYPAASPELVGRIGAFLDAEERDPGLARVVIECRDIVERALRSRALPA